MREKMDHQSQQQQQQTLTAAAIIQQTANRISMLENEMKQTEIMVDNWSRKQQEETGLIYNEHNNLMNSLQSEYPTELLLNISIWSARNCCC